MTPLPYPVYRLSVVIKYHADTVNKEGVAYGAKVPTEAFGPKTSTELYKDQSHTSVPSILYSVCVYKIV